MSANLSVTDQSGSFLSWAPVLAQVELAIEAVKTAEGAVLLTLWANRGGGKTTCLHWLQAELAGRETIVMLGLWDVAAVPLDEALSQICAAVQSAAAHKTKVLLIDNVDRLLSEEAEAFFRFEKEIVLPLVERGDGVLVSTSRSMLRQWQEYEVRDRHANWPIPVLNDEDLAWLAARWGMPVDRLKTATLGYPQVAGWLRDQPNLADDELADQISVHFFSGLSEQVIKLARAVCLLPMFNAAILWQILAEDKPTAGSLYADVLDRLREMIGAGLIFWDPPSGMYRFASGVVWRLLARSRWQPRDAEVRRVHETAASYFKLEARRLAYLPYSLIGALYHLSSVSRFDEAGPPGEAALRWLNENFSLWLGADWPRVWAVWRSGADNPNLVVEIQSLLGQEVYEEISRRLQQAAQPVEAQT
jgi:hypothetical protein